MVILFQLNVSFLTLPELQISFKSNWIFTPADFCKLLFSKTIAKKNYPTNRLFRNCYFHALILVVNETCLLLFLFKRGL